MTKISFFTSETLRDVVQNYLIMSLAITLVVSYIQYLWKRRYLYIHSWKVEGPLSFPIIGSASLFSMDMTDMLYYIEDLHQSISKGLLKFWLGPKLVYIISKPEYIEKVLYHPKALAKDSLYHFFSEAMGFGLLTAPVDKWKHHRKVLAPTFNQKILDSFVGVFAENSIIFAEQLKSIVGQKNFDLDNFSTRYTMDTICQTAMGVNMNIQKGNGKFGIILEKFLEALTYRIFTLWCHPGILWRFSSTKAVFEKYLVELNDTISSVVSKKMAEQKKKLQLKQRFVEAEIEDEPTYKRQAFLDLIIKDSGFTETELREEVNIFLLGGTETTASSICSLFTMLGMHPKVQQKVYEEVIDILGPDRIVEASDLQSMKYTERVIKENLRLFPISSIIARAIEEDIVLGDVILPAGSTAAFCPFYTNRNPEHWTDPLKFDPDRFLPEEVAKRHPCTFISFSHGPRNCIGWRYAIANLKVNIATVIRQYKIFTEYKSVEDIHVRMNMVLRMTEGSKVWLEQR